MNVNGTLRLQKEYQQITESKTITNFVAVPNPDNLFEWHYVVYNLKNCPYEGGYYHGKILFPKEYPMKPPGILMITPSGRFEEKQRICMTMTDYHPESWNPVWKVESIMTGFVSFMTGNEWSVGGIQESDAVRKKKAAASLKWNLDNDKDNNFISLFSHLFGKLGINHPAEGNAAGSAKEEEKKSTDNKASSKKEEKKKGEDTKEDVQKKGAKSDKKEQDTKVAKGSKAIKKEEPKAKAAPAKKGGKK